METASMPQVTGKGRPSKRLKAQQRIALLAHHRENARILKLSLDMVADKQQIGKGNR
jgi:hypothetical protein